MQPSLPFAGTDDHEIELAAVDLRVARAFWEGVPTARLLARIRLDRDERGLVDLGERASGADLETSTWDKLMARLLGGSRPAHERVKRAIARHGRAASDEGPLVANDPAIAALVHALLSATESEGDSSPAEGVADGAPIDASVRSACGRLDPRLSAPSADRRAAAFEACLHIAIVGNSVPTVQASLLAGGEKAISLAPLYPLGDDEVPIPDRHALLLDRSVADACPALAREAAALASRAGALIAFVMLEPRSSVGHHQIPPSSWLPADFSSREAAARLAAALERGATTAPGARAVIVRGGDQALDSIGAEMLNVAAHPFASAVFADILGRASRGRDVVRLVSYFAIAPDAATAAHALAASTAREVPTVLRAWLESILPTDGSDAPPSSPDSDPDLSAGARVMRCVAALAPYPHLYAAVQPLLRRTSEYPPPRA